MLIKIILFIALHAFGFVEVLGCTFDASCIIEHSDSQQHCVDYQCMSFIREPCGNDDDDGTHCYNNIEGTSFGTECVEDVCKVLTGNKCNHDVDCALESDKCMDQKCTPTICNCKSYHVCVDYKCTAKTCSSTPDCWVRGGEDGGSESFCFENYCRPLASFGAQSGISSDCGEPTASCINGICAIQNQNNQIDKDDNDEKSSFGGGFITGFLIAGVIGFAIYAGSMTNCIRECFQKLANKIGHWYGEVAVVEGELVSENEFATGKQIQLSNIL